MTSAFLKMRLDMWQTFMELNTAEGSFKVLFFKISEQFCFFNVKNELWQNIAI